MPSNQIQTSSRKLFTAHFARSNSHLNLTQVTGTTNGFIFQIINSLTECWGAPLTCFDCKLCHRFNLVPRALFSKSREKRPKDEVATGFVSSWLKSLTCFSFCILFVVLFQRDGCGRVNYTLYSLILRTIFERTT